MGWSAPAPELNNYTSEDNIRYNFASYDYNQYLSQEDLAWVCNQRDDCSGFLFNKSQGRGGWISYTNQINWNTRRSDSTSNAWKKISIGWRKANNPDTNVEGVLASPTTRFIGRDDSSSSDIISVLPGKYCAGNPGYSRANSLDTYFVPLGWKFMITDNTLEVGSSVEGYYDRGGAGNPGNFRLDNPINHGMTNKDDCILVQNIGFDVAAKWNSMTNVSAADQTNIKYNWCMNNYTNSLCDTIITNYCNASIANMQSIRCDTRRDAWCLSSVSNMQSSTCSAQLANIVNLCVPDEGRPACVSLNLGGWSNNTYGCPSGYNVWTKYVSSADPVIFMIPKGGSSSYSIYSSPHYGTLSFCATACNNDSRCMGFGRWPWQGWNWTSTTNPDDPNSTAAYCQLYYSWKNPSDTFTSVGRNVAFPSAYGPARYYQKVTQNCVYTDPGASACTNQCTRQLTITQQAQSGGTACPNTTVTCTNNQGQCCTSVLTGAYAGRGSFSNSGSGCQLTCNSPYYGTNCSNWCPRTGGWGLDYPADGTLGSAAAYAFINGVRQIVTPNSKDTALLYTSDGWGGTWNAGTPNSSCNGNPTCGNFANGLGSWFTSGSDTGNPCRYAQCNTDIGAANGSRNVLSACAAVCNALPNGHGLYSGPTCSTVSCYSWSSTLNGVTMVTGNYTGATCDTLTCNTDIPAAQGYRRTSDCLAVCSALANGLGTWSGIACATQACYTVTTTTNGVTTTSGQFGGTNCSTLTCYDGYTKTTDGTKCCPTPSGVPNPAIYIDSSGYCVVSNCPRLANNNGTKTSVPNGGCTGTPVCDRLPSETGGYTGSTCDTLTCNAGDTRRSYTGPSCTLTCNRTPNNRGVYSGTNCQNVTCDRTANNKGGYSGNDCEILTCDNDLQPYGGLYEVLTAFGTRSGSDCSTVTCTRFTNGSYGPAGVCTGTPVCDRLPNNLGIYGLSSYCRNYLYWFTLINATYVCETLYTCSPTYSQPVCDSIPNGVRVPGPNNDCTVINCDTALFGIRSGPSCTLTCNTGYSLSSSGTKCCRNVQGAQSYDDTCSPVIDCVLKEIGPDAFWSVCSTMVCGQTGTQTRTRVIDTAAAYGGRACAATLDRRTETDATLLSRGALLETRACTTQCTDMKELPKDVAVTKCAADENCKVIGFEENAGFSLHSTVSTSTSSPYNYDALFVKVGETAPTVSATKETPAGYIVQASKKYSNIIPISEYVNPEALAPGSCIRIEDQCTLDSQCVGFDINSTGECSILMTNMTDLSNVYRWSSTTNASVTTYLKSQV